MAAQDLAEWIERLAEGLRARPNGDSAPTLAGEVQQLLDRVQQLQQIEGGEQERQQLHR